MKHVLIFLPYLFHIYICCSSVSSRYNTVVITVSYPKFQLNINIYDLWFQTNVKIIRLQKNIKI